MNQSPNDTSQVHKMVADWMRSGFDFWEKLLTVQTPAGFQTPATPFFSQEKTADMQKNMEAGLKLAKLVTSMLTDPASNAATLKGLDSLPETLLDTVQQGWNDMLVLQNKWIEAFSKMAQPSPAYTFDDLNHEFFETVRRLYETEIQKYLNIPPLGLTRFYQERTNRFMDQYNLFQSSLSEFTYLFYVPLEKSQKVMRDQFGEMLEKGEVHDNFKEYYKMWIKTLEGHYMTLLQSPEYTRVMDNTIDALVQYRQAREDFLSDLLADVPVPTYKEMDELYKEIYTYKGKVRELSARLERLEQAYARTSAVEEHDHAQAQAV